MINNLKTNQTDPNKIVLPKFDPSIFFGEGKKTGSDPQNVLKEIGVKAGEVVVDFGCGVGFFVIETAEMVGGNGKVIAVDINRDLLDSVKAKSLSSGLRNVYGILADLEVPGSTKLENNSVDLVLIINLLYLVNEKEAVIREAHRILKDKGRIAIMDWKDNGQHTTLDKEQIISGKNIKELAKKSGFVFQKTFEAGLSHEINMFIK